MICISALYSLFSLFVKEICKFNNESRDQRDNTGELKNGFCIFSQLFFENTEPQ